MNAEYDYDTPAKFLAALDDAVTRAINDNCDKDKTLIIVPDALLDNVVAAYMDNPNTVVTNEDGTYYKGYAVWFKFSHHAPIKLAVRE